MKNPKLFTFFHQNPLFGTTLGWFWWFFSTKDPGFPDFSSKPPTLKRHNFFVREPILIIFGALISYAWDLFISEVFYEIQKILLSLATCPTSRFLKNRIHSPNKEGFFIPPGVRERNIFCPPTPEQIFIIPQTSSNVNVIGTCYEYIQTMHLYKQVNSS